VELGELGRAEEHLREVVEIFRKIHVIERAVATTELVRVQLLQGHHDRAYGTAQTMLRLLGPLRKNRLASAAIADLLRSGAAGLNLVLVERVRAKMEKAKERQQGRSPKASD